MLTARSSIELLAKIRENYAAEKVPRFSGFLPLHLEPVLGEAAWSASRHEGYLRSPYHRHVMKSGGYRSSAAKNKAIIVVAHAILGQVAGA